MLLVLDEQYREVYETGFATASPTAACSCSAPASRSSTERSSRHRAPTSRSSRPRARPSRAPAYTAGSGVPGPVAIQPDQQGDRAAAAYAKGIAAPVAASSKRRPARPRPTSSAGQSACGGPSELVQAGFDTFVEAGYDSQLAYFERLHELKLIVDLMYEKGLAGMRYSISRTAEYVDYSRGKRVITCRDTRELSKIFGEIRSGDIRSRVDRREPRGRRRTSSGCALGSLGRRSSRRARRCA